MSGIKHLMEEQAEADFQNEESEDFMERARCSHIESDMLYPYGMKPLTDDDK